MVNIMRPATYQEVLRICPDRAILQVVSLCIGEAELKILSDSLERLVAV